MAKTHKPKKIRKVKRKVIISPKMEKIKPFDSYKKTSYRFFGETSDKYSSKFYALKRAIEAADMKILLRTYLSIIILSTLIVFFATLMFSLTLTYLLEMTFYLSILTSFVSSLIASSITFILFYMYPFSRAKKRKTDIETNLPFALTQMAAISSSGVTPKSMFRILSEFEEYGEISKEAGRIFKNIEVFGLNEIAAIKEVMAKTPSQDFKQILGGILSNIQTGGDIKAYLNQEAERALFNYKISRQRYNELLSTYADFYTALLIAMPLLIIAVLAVLSVMGGNVFGMAINDVINMTVFLLLPLLNVIFIIFIHLTQPKV